MALPKKNSNLVAQKLEPQSAPGFWDKADRIVVMVAGGAALGSAIAQIPGAIVGATLAGSYGCYITARFSRKCDR
jgi:hypothetical protein